MENNRTNQFFMYGVLGLIFPLDPNGIGSIAYGIVGVMALLMGAMSCAAGFLGPGIPVSMIGLAALFAAWRSPKVEEAPTSDAALRTETAGASDATGIRPAPMLLVLLVNASILLQLVAAMNAGSFIILSTCELLLVIFFDWRWMKKRREARSAHV